MVDLLSLCCGFWLMLVDLWICFFLFIFCLFCM